MAELPNNKVEPSLARSFRHWLERDFNETRPFSLTFAFLPLLPAMFGEQLALSETAITTLWFLGGPLALSWFVYVMFRSIRNSFRNTRRLFADARAQKLGHETPTYCPACGLELTPFTPPKDGRSYHFLGWNCENCGTMVDQYGRSI